MGNSNFTKELLRGFFLNSFLLHGRWLIVKVMEFNMRPVEWIMDLVRPVPNSLV